MKRLNIFASLLVVILLASCGNNKEEDVVPQKAQVVNAKSPSQIFLNGIPASKSEIDLSKVQHTIVGGKSINHFGTDAEFEKFLNKSISSSNKREDLTFYANELKVFKLTQQVAKLADNLNLGENFNQKDKIPQEIQSLLNKIADLNAASKRNQKTEGLGALVFNYDGPNYSGVMVPYDGFPHPFIALNNKISSFTFVTGNSMRFFDRTLFRGASIHFENIATCSDLGIYGWNNRAGSYN